jgi:isopropylmalate/homocitrate/citramalate synthase
MKVLLCDVGPRDGLQNEPDVLSAATRADLVRRLAAAGLPRVEAVSFVRDDLVPQMAGAEGVVAEIGGLDGTELSGLVLNERGWERLAATALARVNCTIAATESFILRYAKASVEDALAGVLRIVAAADRPVTVTISCAFGCPFEGEVDPGTVVALCERLQDADELVLADTIGVAAPTQVRRLLEATGAHGFHGHNTRNTGYASAWAALEAGARVLDASVGGLGGCPFAPRATGNIATEDLVYLLEREGVETGIDLDALIRTSEWLESIFGRTLPGQVYRAGGFPTTASATSAATASAE